MKLEIHERCLKIIPDRFDNDGRALDTVFIEEVLGLKKDGDTVKLKRKNAYGVSCIAFLETVKE